MEKGLRLVRKKGHGAYSMMNFYFQDNNQDRIFLEVVNKYNLAYWIASDIDHYIEHKNNISGFEYNNLILQFKEAYVMFDDAFHKSKYLGGDHKICADALKNFVCYCIASFNFYNQEKALDSESKDIELMSQLEIENKFQNLFISFVKPSHFEYHLLKSYSFVNQVTEDVLFLNLDIHPDKRLNINNNIIEAFGLAKETIDFALNNENCFDGIIDDFQVIRNSKKNFFLDKDFIDIRNKNIDFMRLWRELYYVNEQLYKDLTNDGYDVEQVELDLFQKEIKDYLCMINAIGIDLCESVLKIMDIHIPNIIRYSGKLIQNPMSYIKVK